MLNGVNTNIIRVEGKDVIGGKCTVKANNYKKYKATFDYSLVALELEKDGAEFNTINNKQYTNDIVLVKFKFGIDEVKENELKIKAIKNYVKNKNEIEIRVSENIIKDNNNKLKNELLIDKEYEEKVKNITNKIKLKNKNEINQQKEIIENNNNKLRDKLLINETDELKVYAINNYINNKNQIEIKNETIIIKRNNNKIKRELLVDKKHELRKMAIEKYMENKNYIDLNNNKFLIKKNNKAIQNVLISDYLMNRKEIREDLYKNGFDITFAETGEIIHYQRFLRSSGSSRVGKCLFIKQELHDKIINWCYMGLNIDEMTETDLASLEAYLALPASSIIDTITGITPENILFINEVKSTFEEKAMCTEIVKDKKGQDVLYTEEKNMDITNSINDGQALLCESIFEENGYKDKGMLLLRNRFFKGACFQTRIQKWFEDNKITKIEQLNGYTRATDISQIKLIFNDTCVKFVKFGTREEWLDRLEDNWGICKYEKPTHHFKGNLVSTHYQLLNTLNFNRNEMLDILQPTMDYFNLMLNDTRIMRNFIGAKVDDIEDLKDGNLAISALVGINDEYAETKLYKNFRDDKRKAFIKELQKGRILIKGTYSVLFGNGIEMLKEAIGQYKGNSILRDNEVYCTAFGNTELLGCRSPHVTMGNLALMKNIKVKAIDDYFKLTDNIICVNSIKANTLERLSSADFDSDQLLLTDSPLMIEKLRLHYDRFLVPTSNVKAKKVKRLNNAEQKCDLDVKTSVNKIGEIINLSQILNTLLWDKYNKTGEFDMDIYVDACQLDVMSCLEIDASKKEFSISNIKELEKLRKKYKIDSYADGKTQIKPYFMKFTGKLKEEEKEQQQEKIEFKKFDTSMDFLEDIIEKEFKNIKAKKLDKYKTIKEIIINTSKEYKVKDANRHQIPNIIDIINKNKSELNALYLQIPSKDLNAEEIKEFNADRYNKIVDINNGMYEEIKGLDIKIETIKKLLIESEDKYSSIARKIFTVMFITNKDKMIELLKSTKDENVTKYIMCNRADADITIYGLGYKEVVCN